MCHQERFLHLIVVVNHHLWYVFKQAALRLPRIVVLVKTFPFDEVEMRLGGWVEFFVENLVNDVIGGVCLMPFLFFKPLGKGGCASALRSLLTRHSTNSKGFAYLIMCRLFLIIQFSLKCCK